MEIEFLRKFCLSLPATSEEIKWDDDLCFMVGGRMFCVAALEGPSKVSFKVSDEQFDELSEHDGIIPAPYMARAKWIQVQDPSIFSKKEWETFLRNSYELVKAKLTKKHRKELGLD